jgi:hypothetical protein
VFASTVTATDCQFYGASSFGGRFYYYPTALGVDATASVLTLSRCTVRGGDGWSLSPYSASPGLSAVNGVTSIHLTNTVGAGQQGTVPMPAVTTSGGMVTVDPLAALVPANGAPAVAGTATVVRTWLPALSGSGAPPGANATADAFSAAGT